MKFYQYCEMNTKITIIFFLFSILLCFFQNIKSIETNSYEDIFTNFDEQSCWSIKNNEELKYKLPIKYHITKTVVTSKFLLQALQIIEKETCITFKRKDKVFSKEGFLFVKSKKNAFSIGPSSKNRVQPILFDNKCESSVGCLLNLILHTLGMDFTHNRSDRDKYISFKSINYTDNNRWMFKKKSDKVCLKYSTSYDYGSILHEETMFMSSNGKPSLVSKTSPYYNKMIGQRYYPSFNDFKTLNKYYCSDTCMDKKLKCHNSGYLNPKNCSNCKCPNGYSGTLCQGLPKSTKKCGKRNLKASKKIKQIKANCKVSCTYQITAGENKKISLKIRRVSTWTKPFCSEKMGFEVKYRKDKGATGLCLCGDFNNIRLRSEDNKVMIEFKGKIYWHNFLIEYKEI